MSFSLLKNVQALVCCLCGPSIAGSVKATRERGCGVSPKQGNQQRVGEWGKQKKMFRGGLQSQAHREFGHDQQ